MPTPLELTLMLTVFIACCALEWWAKRKKKP
jgi:DNA-binding transcriptional regulator of glucitol operon